MNKKKKLIGIFVLMAGFAMGSDCNNKVSGGGAVITNSENGKFVLYFYKDMFCPGGLYYSDIFYPNKQLMYQKIFNTSNEIFNYKNTQQEAHKRAYNQHCIQQQFLTQQQQLAITKLKEDLEKFRKAYEQKPQVGTADRFGGSAATASTSDSTIAVAADGSFINPADILKQLEQRKNQ